MCSRKRLLFLIELCGLILARISRLIYLLSHCFWPLLLIRIFFFFFIGTFGPDRMGLTAPSEYGIAKGQLISFRSRTVTLRLPGSLTTPKGWYHTLRGVITRRLMRAHACNFGQFEPIYKQIERLGFVAKIVKFVAKIASFSFDRLPSGPFNPSGTILWPKMLKTSIFGIFNSTSRYCTF